ncbi:MAG: hypothetical protein ABI925_04585 [Verrucomicrobiota bacterium]
MPKRCLRVRIISISIFALVGISEHASAGPFEDFFHSLKHAFGQPAKKPVRRKTQKRTAETASSKTSTDAANNPPTRANTRAVSQPSALKNSKGDFPYGTPVPGKKGFVTSPFAPDSGYIDVSGIAPGTPVKDPYTGKVFLTP